MRTRILIVDDEPNIRLVLKVALHSDQYELMEACNGGEALRVIETEAPSLMVLDLRMPGIDGLGVLSRLNEGNLPFPKTIVLTAHGSIDLAVKAIRLGAADFLEKPVNPDDLRLSVVSLIGEAHDEKGATSAAAGSGSLIDRIRRDLQTGKYGSAEDLLIQLWDLSQRGSIRDKAIYLNLVGIVHEAEGRLHEARTFFKKAIAADREFKPPQDNLWNLYDLLDGAQSGGRVVLTDEHDAIHLPNHRNSQN